MRVLIIDYQICNLGSVKRAFIECGAEVIVSSNPRNIENASHVVLPGVGAFSKAMNNLEQLGWVDSIRKVAADGKKPILGICLGMQLLGNISYENCETKGLGILPGQIVRLLPDNTNERVPHVGWNELHILKCNSILQSIASSTDFYFVHSFHFRPSNKSDIIANTPYCGGFVSVIQSNNIIGVQFHPEKSSRAGFQLIKNFLKL